MNIMKLLLRRYLQPNAASLRVEYHISMPCERHAGDGQQSNNASHSGLGVQNPFYIATSKGPGPTALVLRELLGIDLPPDSPRLMTSLIPPDTRKAEALR